MTHHVPLLAYRLMPMGLEVGFFSLRASLPRHPPSRACRSPPSDKSIPPSKRLALSNSLCRRGFFLWKPNKVKAQRPSLSSQRNIPYIGGNIIYRLVAVGRAYLSYLCVILQFEK